MNDTVPQLSLLTALPVTSLSLIPVEMDSSQKNHRPSRVGRASLPSIHPSIPSRLASAAATWDGRFGNMARCRPPFRSARNKPTPCMMPYCYLPLPPSLLLAIHEIPRPASLLSLLSAPCLCIAPCLALPLPWSAFTEIPLAEPKSINQR